MIDLHIHTKYSDGTKSLIEILKEAQSIPLDIISITDHDSVKAYFEIDSIDTYKYYKGKIIVGCEFNCLYDNIRIELICYNFDYKQIDKYLSSFYAIRVVLARKKEELDIYIEKCKKHGIRTSKNLKVDKKLMVIDILYDDIVKYEENKKFFAPEVFNSKTIFYRKCVNDKEFILYKDYYKDVPSALDISKLVKKSGGKVFLAHPYVYALEDHLKFINNIYKDGIIDGLECYHSNFTESQTNTLLEYAKKNNLLISGGTDYHGDKYPQIHLGRGYNNKLKISDEIVDNWINL